MDANNDEQISVTDYQALAEFRYQIRRFIRYSEQVARSAGIEPQQHQVLLAIKGLPNGEKATIGKLAERLQLQHHSTVELINRLCERGLVERQRDETDQRRVLVHLTAQGEAMLQLLSTHTLAELQLTGPTLVKTLEGLLSGKMSNG